MSPTAFLSLCLLIALCLCSLVAFGRERERLCSTCLFVALSICRYVNKSIMTKTIRRNPKRAPAEFLLFGWFISLGRRHRKALADDGSLRDLRLLDLALRLLLFRAALGGAFLCEVRDPGGVGLFSLGSRLFGGALLAQQLRIGLFLFARRDLRGPGLFFLRDRFFVLAEERDLARLLVNTVILRALRDEGGQGNDSQDSDPSLWPDLPSDEDQQFSQDPSGDDQTNPGADTEFSTDQDSSEDPSVSFADDPYEETPGGSDQDPSQDPSDNGSIEQPSESDGDNTSYPNKYNGTFLPEIP